MQSATVFIHILVHLISLQYTESVSHRKTQRFSTDVNVTEIHVATKTELLCGFSATPWGSIAVWLSLSSYQCVSADGVRWNNYSYSMFITAAWVNKRLQRQSTSSWRLKMMLMTIMNAAWRWYRHCGFVHLARLGGQVNTLAYLILETLVLPHVHCTFGVTLLHAVILKLSGFKISVFNVYRPPSVSHYSKPNSVFLDEFNSFLLLSATTPHEFIITGDFNIHVDNCTNHFTSQFLSLLSSFNLTQHVHFPLMNTTTLLT